MSINFEFTKGFSYDRSSGDLWLANGGHYVPLGNGTLGAALGAVDRLQGDGQGLQLVPEGHYRIRHSAPDGADAPWLEIWHDNPNAKAPYVRVGGGLDRHLRTAVCDLIAIGFDRLAIHSCGSVVDSDIDEARW